MAPAQALARIPDSLDAAEAGPLLCAGITTFNALRNSGARPGDTALAERLAVTYEIEGRARDAARVRRADTATRP